MSCTSVTTIHVNSLTSQMRVEQMLPIIDLDPNEADEGLCIESRIGI